MTEEEIQAKIEQERKWDSSPEGISYRLCVFGVSSVEDRYYEGLIVRVLHKLPEEVRDFILDGPVSFILAMARGTVHRMTFFLPSGKDRIERDFIVLRFDRSDSDDSTMMTTIAHEIAHVYLGHTDESKCHGGAKVEQATDDLIESWGFPRAYESYDQFHGSIHSF